MMFWSWIMPVLVATVCLALMMPRVMRSRERYVEAKRMRIADAEPKAIIKLLGSDEYVGEIIVDIKHVDDRLVEYKARFRLTDARDQAVVLLVREAIKCLSAVPNSQDYCMVLKEENDG